MPAVSRLNRAVVVMCGAQACAQIGAFGVAALIPTLIPAWSLSNTEAGWISGIYYAAYTLVVPLLSSLTDRVDPKRIYLGSVALTAVAFAGFAWVSTGFWSALAFRALMGVGWAGSYMPGLKALSDVAEGPQQSRAVAAHAAAVGISGALPFGVAGAVNVRLGWPMALAPGRLGPAALVLVYAMLIWSDSSSLTAGSAGSAEPGRRGATLAVHSTLGYAGGFLVRSRSARRSTSSAT